eukprot:GHVL01004318.1.p4 GENE.GHVL01004318.1~~GHVL01004318.1.p4  ORF type:complete len:145 (-),score=6.70 GHVL01004318.1:2724-3158(-)
MKLEAHHAGLTLVVRHAAFQLHPHAFDDVTIHHLTRKLFLDTGNPDDLDLADDPSSMAAIDGQLVTRLHCLQTEGKALRVAVGPEVIVVEIQGVPGEGQTFAVAKADGQQGQGLALEEVTVGAHMTDAVAETWEDPTVHIDTCG